MACLLISEVVTNALLHAGTDIVLVLTLDRGMFRCSVTDGGQGVPTVRPLDDESLTGRGLALVDGLAAQWGVEPARDGGKTVWFALDASDVVDTAASEAARRRDLVR